MKSLLIHGTLDIITAELISLIQYFIARSYTIYILLNNNDPAINSIEDRSFVANALANITVLPNISLKEAVDKYLPRFIIEDAYASI